MICVTLYGAWEIVAAILPLLLKTNVSVYRRMHTVYELRQDAVAAAIVATELNIFPWRPW